MNKVELCIRTMKRPTSSLGAESRLGCDQWLVLVAHLPAPHMTYKLALTSRNTHVVKLWYGAGVQGIVLKRPSRTEPPSMARLTKPIRPQLCHANMVANSRLIRPNP